MSLRSGVIPLSCLLTLFLALASCAVNPVTGEKQVSLVSEQQEVEIGKQADEQVKQEYGLYGQGEFALARNPGKTKRLI